MITFSSVDFSYNKKQFVFKNLSLTIPDSNIVGLQGDNGKGKSTFLRLINQSLEPDNGNIVSHGNVRSFLTNRGLYSSQFNAFDSLKLFSIREGLEFNKRLIEEFVDFSELSNLMFNRPISSWSTGQAVRLAIFFLLKSNSDILLIDEFIGGGDNSFREKVRKLIHSRVLNSQIVLIASHDKKFLESLSDSYIDFNDKKIVLRSR